jgi:hypothetical protein
MAVSEALPVGMSCPWCWRDSNQQHAISMTHVGIAVEPTEMAKKFPPGTPIKHRLSGQEMTVLELEGDGSSGWFTARGKDFSTHRINYVEVEPSTEPVKTHGQYL